MGFENIKQSPSCWQHRLDNIAVKSGLHSILIMESKPDTMQVVVANDQPIYHVGDCGPKSKKSGGHELYCERVVDTAQPLFIPEARIDDEWRDNEDFVKFNLGVYFGYPIVHQGVAVGTICALNDKRFDFNAGSPSVSSELKQLKVDLELALLTN
jgi:GAF domain-containing protein